MCIIVCIKIEDIHAVNCLNNFDIALLVFFDMELLYK